MRSMWMKKLSLGAFLFFVGSAGAVEGQNTELSTEVTSPQSGRRLFELGVSLNGALPGQFDGFEGMVDNGVGAGFGLSAGIRPLSHLTIFAFVERMDHNADAPQSRYVDEYATNGSGGIGAKVFPLGDSGPRFYGLTSIAITQHWIHQDFTLIPESGKGIGYRGNRYAFGVGYEHPISNNFLIYGEFDMSYTSLDRRVIKDRGAFPLVSPLTRWTPMIRLGMTVTL